MASESFAAQIHKFFQAEKEAKKTSVPDADSYSQSEDDNVPQFRSPAKANVFILFSTQQCNINIEENPSQSSSESQKKSENEVIIIEDSDNSDSDDKVIKRDEKSKQSMSEDEEMRLIQKFSMISKTYEKNKCENSQKPKSSEENSFRKDSDNSTLLLPKTEKITCSEALKTLPTSSICKSLSTTKQRGAQKRRCTSCKKSFHNFAFLQRHLMFHCPLQKKNKYLCKICGNSFSGDGIFHHLATVHYVQRIKDQKLFVTKLPICDSTSRENKVHRASNKNTAVCKLCGKSYSKRKWLAIHEKNCCNRIKTERSADTTTLQSFVCRKCNAKFENIENLEKHIPKCKLVEQKKLSKKYCTCKLCDKHYSSKNSLRIHSRFYCSGRKFGSYENKQLQLFTCRICNKIFTTKQNLQKHEAKCKSVKQVTVNIKRKPGKGRFQCIGCNKLISYQNNLRRHHRTCKMYQNLDNDNMKKKSTGSFTCEFCGRNFKEQKHWTTHKRYFCKNSNEKLPSCENCGKRFWKTSVALGHKRICSKKMVVIHGSEKTSDESSMVPSSSSKMSCQDGIPSAFYMCGICHKNDFPWPKALEMHLKLHKKINIVCNSCKTSFDTYITFKTHLKKRFRKPYACSYSSSENNRVIQTPVTENPFVCNVCNKLFPDIHTLVNHIQKHLEVEGNV